MDHEFPTWQNDMCTTTPINIQKGIITDNSLELRIKRDDLYPYPGGGTKARKMTYIMQDILKNNQDVIVTNGGPQSNHARAAALMAASKKIHCHLVIVLEPDIRYPITGNLLLMQMTGAKIEYCLKEELAEYMDRAIGFYKTKGFNPAYIWGGGHCHAGTLAFVEAANEACTQCGKWVPDFVVHASGTGTTQAGLAIGYADLPTRVIGISVARNTARGGQIVHESINEYYENTGMDRKNIIVDFRDDWICGGYEKTNKRLMEVVEKAAKAGLILDPTYSGKAFLGLTELAGSGEIPAGSKVLFWHTGGLMNLMGSSFAKDFISL